MVLSRRDWRRRLVMAVGYFDLIQVFGSMLVDEGLLRCCLLARCTISLSPCSSELLRG